ncbi:MAG: hypothetical protein PHQ72_09120 [Hespellia sp.]|nr:hypothetical protein [Hespellia sp.]
MVRDVQEGVRKTVHKAWMTTSGDVGMQWDIHPKNKKTIGERLALLARGHVYQEEILCDPPEMKGVQRQENDIIITFSNAKGLHVKGNELQALSIITHDKDIGSGIDFEIQDDKLILHQVPNPCEIRYGKEPYCEINLYNEADIPVIPFEWLSENFK